jgi:hypothetical protein
VDDTVDDKLAGLQGEKQGPQRKVTRHMKRRYNEINHIQQGIEDLDPTTQALEREHEKVRFLTHVPQALHM